MNWDELEESVLYIIGKDEMIREMQEDIKRIQKQLNALGKSIERRSD